MGALVDMDTAAYRALPDDAAERRKALERRTKPSATKPAVAPETEARLAEIDEKSAQCYIEAEDMTYRLQRMANKIDKVVPRYGRGPILREDGLEGLEGLIDE